MPTLDPRLAGFTNSGRPSASRRRRGRRAVAPPLEVRQHLVGRLRQAARGKQRLHRGLVHAGGRGEHAGAHVGHGGQFQQALHRAVFAERSVQHREHDVEAEAGDDRAFRFALAVIAGRPALDGDQRVFARVRDQQRVAAGTWQARRLHALLFDHLRGREGRRGLVGEHPASILLDADRHRLVARRDRGA